MVPVLNKKKEECYKVWNEDLVAALEARADLARQQHCSRQVVYTWQTSAKAIQAVRPDIYYSEKNIGEATIMNLPSNILSKQVDQVCRSIITGMEPIYPKGYTPFDPDAAILVSHTNSETNTNQIPKKNPYVDDIYLNRIKKRGGAYAILVALTVNEMIGASTCLNKQQLCKVAQRYCDEEMLPNYHAGRPKGAIESIKTLQKHGLIIVHMNRSTKAPWTYELSNDGKLFVKALIEVNPPLKHEINQWVQKHGDNISSATTNSVGDCKSVEDTNDDSSNIFATSRPSKAIDNTVNSNSNKNSGRSNQNVYNQDSIQTYRNPYAKKTSIASTSTSTTGTSTSSRPYCIQHQDTGANRTIPSRIASMSGVLQPRYDNKQTTSQNSNLTKKKIGSSSLLFDLVSDDDEEINDDSEYELPKIDENEFVQHTTISSVVSCSQHETNECGIDQTCTEITNQMKFLAVCTTNKKGNNSISKTLQPTSKVFEIDSDDDNDDDILNYQPFQATSGSNLDHQCATKIENKNTPLSSNRQLIIYIDDRERNRNITPRELRIGLTKITSSGLVSTCWPRTIPKAIVQEKRLQSGDFAFETVITTAPHTTVKNLSVNDNSVCVEQQSRRRQIPILVERKRIGDLVQRSCDKDHWYQLQRMNATIQAMQHDNNSCPVIGVSVMLLEGDTRTACQYEATAATASNDLDEDIASIFDMGHTITDEESLYRFIGHAILRNDRVRFTQAKDEQASLRAVASLGLMATLSTKYTESTDVCIGNNNNRIFHDWKTNRSNLIKRIVRYNEQDQGLVNIRLEVAESVADEFGSCDTLDRLYRSIKDISCCAQVLQPIFQGIKMNAADNVPYNIATTSLQWSTMVYKAFMGIKTATCSDVTVMTEINHERRVVEISVPYQFESIFDDSLKDDSEENEHEINEENKFYNLIPQTNTCDKIPTIRFCTIHGPYRSSCIIALSILDGDDVLCYIKASFVASHNDCTKAAQMAATKIRGQLGISLSSSSTTSTTTTTNNHEKMILLVRGMNCSINNAAKQNGFRPELRLLVDTVQAELMIHHGVVVLHAQRLQNDIQMIVQQLALSCYQYQLVDDINPNVAFCSY